MKILLIILATILISCHGLAYGGDTGGKFVQILKRNDRQQKKTESFSFLFLFFSKILLLPPTLQSQWTNSKSL